ncbi:MAG TPA: alpha/beta fold hydrolase [Actinomycetota bacterium]|nr:alpha/beta fold hydrolase [Actinomycetota bacterium]
MDVERRRLPVSGGELAFVDLGEGPSVLLLHGFPTSSFLWRREVWLLSQGMRVLAPDLLGYGESRAAEGADLSVRAQAGYLRELLGALGVERAAAVGHQVGGAVALELALGAATGGGPRVGALALVDAVCLGARPLAGMEGLLGPGRPERLERALTAFVERAVGRPERRDPGLLEGYLGPWRRDPGALMRAARALGEEPLGPSEAELAALDVPTLVLWGEEDPFVPAALAERLGEVLPDATVALLPGCSHLVNEDAPDTVGLLLLQYLRARYLGLGHRHPEPGPVEVTLAPPRRRAQGGD